MKFICIAIAILITLTIRHRHFLHKIEGLCECYEYYELAAKRSDRVYIYTCDKKEYDYTKHEVFKVYVNCDDPVFVLNFENHH